MPKPHRFIALGVLLLALTAGPALARSPFDGRWLVVIGSSGARCNTAGGYPLSIRDGRVSYLGLAPISVRGRVDRHGRVAVRLDGGGRWAQAAGRLAKNRGAGSWRGRSQRGVCAGR